MAHSRLPRFLPLAKTLDIPGTLYEIPNPAFGKRILFKTST
jgi:hypothetical protein